MGDPPGTFRRIGDPQAEVERLARERQIAASQICTQEQRADGCLQRHSRPMIRSHDPDHCDRVWGAAHD